LLCFARDVLNSGGGGISKIFRSYLKQGKKIKKVKKRGVENNKSNLMEIYTLLNP